MKFKRFCCFMLTLCFFATPVYVNAETSANFYDIINQYSGYVRACPNVDMDNDGINDLIIYNNNNYNYDCYKTINGSYEKIGSVYAEYGIYSADNGIVICMGGSGMTYYKNYYVQDNRLVEGDLVASYEGNNYDYNSYSVNGRNVSESDYYNFQNELYSKELDFQDYKISNSQNYYEAYKVIVDEYINCKNELKDIYDNLDWDAREQLDYKYPDVSLEYFMGEHENEKLCYCLKDINNDSIPELFVASLVNYDGEFYNKYWTWGIYTFNNKILCSYESGMGNRWHCYLLNNNEIFMDSSGGATYNSYSSCKLNGLAFECTELLNWFGDDIRYNGQVVSEREANDFINKKTSNIADLDWKSIYDFNDIQVTPNIKVILNGNELTFDQQPYIENGTTRVPMRGIFESLGATVEYDSATKTITACKGSTIIELATGSATAKINGREMTLTTPVENRNGTTMVPLRFISESLGAEVIWDGENRVITINLRDNKEVTIRGFVLNADNEITINDGAMVYDVLKNNKLGSVNESDIHTLIEPNKQSFDMIIDLIAEDADDNDVTYFYYSGHGGMNRDGIAYICPDYYHNDDDSHDATYIYTYPQLISKLDEIKGTVVIILDCCFSGYINEEIDNLNTDKFKILTSCKSSELSSIEDILINPFDNKEVIHGQFTIPLLEGLGAYNNKVKADYDKDNNITLGELYKYVQSNMKGNQNPTVSNENDETIIFSY